MIVIGIVYDYRSVIVCYHWAKSELKEAYCFESLLAWELRRTMGRHVSQKTYGQTMQLASFGRKPKEILLISLEISRTLAEKRSWGTTSLKRNQTAKPLTSGARNKQPPKFPSTYL